MKPWVMPLIRFACILGFLFGLYMFNIVTVGAGLKWESLIIVSAFALGLSFHLSIGKL